MKRGFVTGLLAVLLVMAASNANATTKDGFKWGLGLAGGVGVGGLSGTMDTDGPISYQAIVDLQPGAAAKLRYAFQREKRYDLYVNGFAGWKDGWGSSGLWAGGGVGVDWDWRSLSPDLPPISWALEIDAATNADGNFGLDINLGIHWNF